MTAPAVAAEGSPLGRGTRLGPYEVLAHLGSGGMGEVYRARDERLGREVALKVVAAGSSTDPDRLRRFEREARAAGALNHPNLVAVLDAGQQDGRPFVVFELLDGVTLRQRLGRGALAFGNALDYAIQMARGLAAAHESGVVHRDLKPDNMFVTRDGRVKILDFGLAKLRPALDPHPAPTSEATASDLTTRGVVLGTAGYMSPEQVRGAAADARSDIFALGAVMYEMFAGQRPFEGATAADVMAAILKEDPSPLTALRPDTPPTLDNVVRRCLEKQPQDRFQSALDVAFALEAIAASAGTGAAPDRVASARARRWHIVAAGLVAVSAVALVVARAPWASHWTAPVPSVVPLTSMSGIEVHPSFSPDGEQVAFDSGGEKLDNWDLYLTMVGSTEVRRLTNDPQPEVAPSWSPDGRQIAFACGWPRGTATHPDGFMNVCLVSPLGGSIRRLSDFPASAGETPSWSPDGRWLAVTRASSPTEPELEGVYLLPVHGGEPRRLALPKGPKGVSCPSLSPDGRHMAYVSQHGVITFSVDVIELSADDLPKGPARQLTPPTVFPEGCPAWTRDGKTVVFGDGRLARTLWRVGVAGDRPPERIEIAGRQALFPAIARSRDRLAFARALRNKGIYRVEAGRPSQPVLASAFADDYNSDLSPDGLRIAFESDRSGESLEVWLSSADGSNPMQLTRGPGLWQGAPHWSPDGRRIAFDSLGADGHWDVWTMDADGGSPRRLTQDPGDEHGGSWSGDGRFVYFTSPRDGGPEVWRIPSGGGPPERLTHQGGWRPRESLDGKTLLLTPSLFDGPLLALPLAGGPARRIVDCVGGFTTGPAGIYYLGCSSGPPRLGDASPGRPPGGTLFVLDPASGRSRLLGQLDWARIWWGLTVSRDGKTILASREVDAGVDLMIINNFR